MHSHVLTDDQITRLHQASLTILERIGVLVPHDELLSRFADRGADVQMREQRVRIPPELVMHCLAAADKEFTLYGRDLSRTAEFSGTTHNYNSSAGQALWVEQPGTDRRYARLSDVSAAVRLADALPHITMPGAMADPRELPVEWRCVAVMAEMVKHTTKPITFWFHDRASARYLMELSIALRGDEAAARCYPICFPFLEPISPLRFPFHGIDLLFETARLNMPVPIGPMAQLGLSAPATMAGTMAQQNAEILAGICITQLIQEGLPVCYGGICHAFDMKTTQLIFSGPEQAIFGVAMTQMGRYYGLPVYINVGLSDSKLPDAQAGLESGITLSLGAAAGANMFGHMGICGVDQAASLDILLMQHEIIAYVESVCRQMDFSDENFAVDLIDEVGPGGSFIDSIHTARHFRKELWFPTLLDRNYYDAWQQAGASDMASRCAARKEQILATHTAEALAPDIERELDRIVATAQQELSPTRG